MPGKRYDTVVMTGSGRGTGDRRLSGHWRLQIAGNGWCRSVGVSLPSLAVAVNPANRLDGLLVNQYTGLPVWRFSWALRFHADGRKFTGLLVSWYTGKVTASLGVPPHPTHTVPSRVAPGIGVFHVAGSLAQILGRRLRARAVAVCRR